LQKTLPPRDSTAFMALLDAREGVMWIGVFRNEAF